MRIKPLRGPIYDSNSEPLVINETRYRLFLEPNNINDQQHKMEIVETIHSVLKIEKASIEAKIESKAVWVSVARSIGEEDRKKIQKKISTGIGFEEEPTRYYPEGSASAHLLGFVGKNEIGENIGYFGVEGYYEKDLRGLPGLIQSERDVLGKPIFVGVQEMVRGEDGRSLTLTIDKTIQILSKNVLKRGIERYGAEKGCITVMNPSSGAIVALTCLPDFDPNSYWNFSEQYFKNPVVSESFEPGSIFKPLIMAPALEEGAVTSTDTFEENGPVTIGGYTIANWNDTYEGTISMTNIIEKSSNVGMVYVGKRLGEDNIRKYLDRYGFGRKTGVDIQGEVKGIVKASHNWYPIDYSTATFGQGISTTSIQIVRAFSALVNGGTLLKPYIVSSIISSDGTVKTISPKEESRIISQRNSLIIRRMLARAVKHGEVKWDVPKGYSIGGKTGTAQIPIQGRYDPSRTIASFIGFAPIENPRFVALITLTEPKTSPWGSETAAPMFFELTQELLLYYNIAPE